MGQRLGKASVPPPNCFRPLDFSNILMLKAGNLVSELEKVLA